ncbi:MAG: sensor histidine kinase [Sarcina sp.]
MSTIILGIGLLIAIIYIIKVKFEVKKIVLQMEQWKGEQINVKTNATDSSLEKLVININRIYDENQKIKAENLRIDNELKRSIANISHDLRTPLTSINGYVQLLKNENVKEEEKAQCIEVIERRTKSLEELITSFYDFSRLQSSDYKFNLKSLNIKNLLLDNIATYYSEFVAKGIEPKIEVVDVENIISDEVVVNRVFSNLIGNMIKHSEQDVEINLEVEEKVIVTRFINDAPDLIEEDINKLFDRFYTKDVSRANANTGLGLSITKAFIENLGSEINASLKNNKLIIEIKWHIKKGELFL